MNLPSSQSMLGGSFSALAGSQAADLTRIIRARQRRKEFFPTHLFSDPAWDMLLTLAFAERAQRRVTVTELCRAADAPSTTALRYIQAMTKEGLVARFDDPLDKRRKFLSLTFEASKQMTAYINGSALSELKAA